MGLPPFMETPLKWVYDLWLPQFPVGTVRISDVWGSSTKARRHAFSFHCDPFDNEAKLTTHFSCEKLVVKDHPTNIPVRQEPHGHLSVDIHPPVKPKNYGRSTESPWFSIFPQWFHSRSAEMALLLPPTPARRQMGDRTMDFSARHMSSSAMHMSSSAMQLSSSAMPGTPVNIDDGFTMFYICTRATTTSHDGIILIYFMFRLWEILWFAQTHKLSSGACGCLVVPSVRVVALPTRFPHWHGAIIFVFTITGSVLWGSQPRSRNLFWMSSASLALSVGNQPGDGNLSLFKRRCSAAGYTCRLAV